MLDAVAPWVDLFRLNTRLFQNAIVDLSEAEAAARPNGRTNSVAFIARHLVETRAWTGRYVGLDTPPPFGGALEHATGIDDIPELPTVAAIRSAWDDVSAVLVARLEGLTAVDLAAPSSQRFPGVAPTVLGGLAFLAQHESYHVGQLAYLRKFHGLPPMSYR